MSDEPKVPEESTEPDAPDESGQPDENQEGYYDQAPKFDRAVEYMETEKGHEVTLRMVTMLEELAPVIKTLIEAKVEGQRVRPKLEYKKWLLLVGVRLIVFVVAVGALIYMRKVGTIDPAIALLIGGLVAYFFGYRSQG